MSAPAKKSGDTVILEKRAYEFPGNDPAEAERKIKQGLRYYGCGPYDQARVNLLRFLKNELQTEIHKHSRSEYYAGSTGKYAAMEDFDIDRLIADYSAEFPQVDAKEITWFVQHAIYLYHMR